MKGAFMKILVKMVFSSIFLAAVLLGNPLISDAAVSLPAKISEVFPDDELANTVANAMRENVNTVVTETDLANIKNSLSIQMKPVSDLEGLQYLTGLTQLDLYYSESITDLSPLSNLTKLTSLNLSGNKISDLSPIANLTNLESLSAASNSISDLTPLASLTKLKYVVLSSQKITNIEKNYSEQISIPNRIKDVAGQPIAPLSISDNGVYNPPNVEWNLSSYLATVSYKFNQIVTVGNYQTDYSGTVTQPLKNVLDYIASFSVDGVISETVTVIEDNLLTEPSAPTKIGYTFTGWYDVEKGGTKWNFATDKMPATDITLYAQFTANNYKVNFDVDGTRITESVSYNTLVSEPQTPVKEGYIFTGWYDDKIGGTKWNFATDKMPATDMTLYARFTASSGSNDDNTIVPEKTPKQLEVNKTSTDTLPKTGDSYAWKLLIAGILVSSSAFVLCRKRS